MDKMRASKLISVNEHIWQWQIRLWWSVLTLLFAAWRFVGRPAMVS